MTAAQGSPYHLLPPELISTIVDHLVDDYRALFNVGLTNKLLHDISRCLLYRRMYSIFNAQSKNRKAGIPRNSNRAVLSVLRNLDLANYVLEYTIEDPRPQFGQSPSTIQTLRDGLYAMVNLRHLNIETFSPERWKHLIDFDSSTSTPHPFKLETFACKGHDTCLTCTTSYEDLGAFLHRQNKLRRVDVQLSREDWQKHNCGQTFNKTGGSMGRDAQIVPFPPSACPQLEWVIGNRAAIEALLPGRKVRILQWKYCWSDARGSVGHLAKELARLEVLALPDPGLLDVEPPALQMAKYMRNLQYLEVQNSNFHLLQWTFALPSLLGIVLLESRDKHRPINTTARRIKVVDFFEQRSTLQFIAVEMPSSLKNKFEMWKRHQTTCETESHQPQSMAREPEYVKYSFIQRIIYPFT